MDDAIPLRHHVLNCFERAAQTSDSSTRESLLRFVIVGGGPTGVEYAGALAELIYGPLLKDFGSITREEVDIRLLDGGERLLAGMPPPLAGIRPRSPRRARCAGAHRITGRGGSVR